MNPLQKIKDGGGWISAVCSGIEGVMYTKSRFEVCSKIDGGQKGPLLLTVRESRGLFDSGLGFTPTQWD
jgi:hypothetical protein